MLNLKQFKTLVSSTLDSVDLGGQIAVNLVFGTALQESNLHYLTQLNGPAVSLFQVEPLTYLDIRHRLCMHLPLRQKILTALYLTEIPEDANFLIGNVSLAIIICRLKYFLDSRPMPTSNDPALLAQYYKTIYNTCFGKAAIDMITKNMQVAVNT